MKYIKVIEEEELTTDLVLAPVEVIIKITCRLAVNIGIFLLKLVVGFIVSLMSVIILVTKKIKNVLRNLIDDKQKIETTAKIAPKIHQVSLDYIFLSR